MKVTSDFMSGKERERERVIIMEDLLFNKLAKKIN